jgi:hypothetical protein
MGQIQIRIGFNFITIKNQYVLENLTYYLSLENEQEIILLFKKNQLELLRLILAD